MAFVGQIWEKAKQKKQCKHVLLEKINLMVDQPLNFNYFFTEFLLPNRPVDTHLFGFREKLSSIE